MDALQHLQTEARNPNSARLDELQSIEIVELMNREDAGIAAAVLTQKTAIAQAIDVVANRLARGGRLIYTGAGTSGRLGVLDASECPPTFQTPHEQIVGLIAGGPGAMFKAVEGAEDSPEQGADDLRQLQLTNLDVVCGIATSGRTPYVIGAVRYARSVGAFTLGLVCTPESELHPEVDIMLAPIVGPEVLTGSTRLKAGTATKLILNMLTTGAMIRNGKSYGNLMVDLKATNIKLVARSQRIVRIITNTDQAKAVELLEASGGEVKTAIVMHLGNTDAVTARKTLADHAGRIKPALAALGNNTTSISTVELPHRPDLLLGIDGGGTSTIAILADASGKQLGRGVAGPSNIQAVGVENGLKALDDCIARAFQSANLPRATVGSICLGLAGVDRQEGLDVINGWASRNRVADRVKVANDATLLLAAGTPDGWGLAVIAGTGSIAFTRTPDGTPGRCGGWGYLLGDEGSAYSLAVSALRAACRSHDGVLPATALVNLLVKKMNLSGPPDFIPAVYRGAWDRSAIAGLAPLVLDCAEAGDALAKQIVTEQATELGRTAAQAVKSAGLHLQPVPIALAGGVLVNSTRYRETLLTTLRDSGVSVGVVQLVPEPVIGAVVLAGKSAVLRGA
jgi:N-acetylmuramic acid 6-phosphate etherase